MQRVLFLLPALLIISGCQRTDKEQQVQELQHLMAEYQKLPEYLQFWDLSDLFLLKPVDQQIELKQAIEGVAYRYKLDSLYFSAIDEPFVDYRTGKIVNSFSSQQLRDSFFLVVRQWEESSFISNLYYLDAHRCHYKRIEIDDSCTLPNSKKQIFDKESFKYLAQREETPKKIRIDSVYQYLMACGFNRFPSRFNNSCIDGEVITVYCKTKDDYKVSVVHCPADLHPLRVILNRVKALLEE
ncbi:MAG: hypothetical protein SFV55_09350 [Haliscomenobacter sp.]|uniref:hypothetical protein n=1 Tax=Haliscomenobacter sp. TaxID=2717303 RepID=UPI0029AC72A3|nr:hypothetical protein [Haliscomenobacter sp.]MDX2068619.1 hypothetical protein [Haliscomenobacter sp.]